jgi:hypothetical protein
MACQFFYWKYYGNIIMALTSTTTFDIVGQTQQIIFYNSGSPVDQINYANNQITFAAESSYNLIKSDLLLYIQYMLVFNNLIISNFPIVLQSINFPWPLSQFDITESNSGVTHLDYTQNSQGNLVLGINYVPVAGSAGFTARSNPITISMQEFFATINFLVLFKVQVNLN